MMSRISWEISSRERVVLFLGLSGIFEGPILGLLIVNAATWVVNLIVLEKPGRTLLPPLVVFMMKTVMKNRVGGQAAWQHHTSSAASIGYLRG